METNSIWEQMACRYDTKDRIQTAKIITEEIRNHLKDTNNKTALDYGCGTGLIGLGLADLFASILLLDPSLQMIEQVKQKINTHQIKSASTLCCDFLEEIPQIPKVDYIIMSQVLLHIKDSRLILERLYHILKEEGHLIIIDFDKNENIISDKVHNGFVQNELIELLKQIGFHSAHAHTFYEGSNLFMNKDASVFLLEAVK